MPIWLATTQNKNKKKSRSAAVKFQNFPGIFMVFQDLCLFPGLSKVCTNPEQQQQQQQHVFINPFAVTGISSCALIMGIVTRSTYHVQQKSFNLPKLVLQLRPQGNWTHDVNKYINTLPFLFLSFQYPPHLALIGLNFGGIACNYLSLDQCLTVTSISFEPVHGFRR